MDTKTRNRILGFTMVYYGTVVATSLVLPGTVPSFEWNDSLRAVETALPAAAAYVAMAINFLRDPRDITLRKGDWSTLRLVVWGPMFLVAVIAGILFYRYISTNSPGATKGAGMSPEFFHGSLAALHAFIGATTGLLATLMFQPADRSRPLVDPAGAPAQPRKEQA